MIRAFVDYSLRNKLLVLAVGIVLLAWGAISFKNLPV
jgi:cobalt-zinc-cadmium resistance protein CzcA